MSKAIRTTILLKAQALGIGSDALRLKFREKELFGRLSQGMSRHVCDSCEDRRLHHAKPGAFRGGRARGGIAEGDFLEVLKAVSRDPDVSIGQSTPEAMAL